MSNDILEQITEATYEALKKITDVGPKVAESIVFFFEQPENAELIDKLRKAGLNFSSKEAEKRGEKPLSDKSFVITGKLSKYSRDDAKELIENLGGIVTSSVTRSTDFAIVGESPGSKLEHAQKLGVTILTEKDFEDLVQQKIK